MAKKQSTNIDEVVLKLQEQIEIKEKELNSISKPNWKTNNNIELYGTRYNLNVQTIDSLILLFSYVIGIFDNFQKASEILEIKTQPLFFGFSYEDWKHDFSLHILIKNKRIKEEQLKALKIKVDSLLSEELKTKKLLEEINNDLINI